MIATAVKERPILFSGPMVRAIIEGRKTMTRRVVKPQPKKKVWGVPSCDDDWVWMYRNQPHRMTVSNKNGGPDGYLSECPYGNPGDRLWVRESGWQCPERTQKMMREGADTWPAFVYTADEAVNGTYEAEWAKDTGYKNRPSIHMPRWASRITLEVTDVRVERLQDISEADAIAEGSQIPIAHLPKACRGACLTERTAFSRIWESINGKGSWAANPWVWVVSFRRMEAAR